MSRTKHCSLAGSRPFVTSTTPVFDSRGRVVGGIEVDANGVLSIAETDPKGLLAQQTRRSPTSRSETSSGPKQEDLADVRRSSKMRKVSLRGLEAAIAEKVAKKENLPAELMFMAGLQRIEYVFVYPETNDIVLAGPAEGWIQRNGNMVGQSSGNAVLRLDDFLDALHVAPYASRGQSITCSIDPTAAGRARLQQVFKRPQLQINEAVIAEMEQQSGDQVVSLTGIRTSGHFARVLVSADYMMKRLAMNLTPSPVKGLPSYLDLVARSSGSSQVTAPRFWMTASYDSIEKSEDGLAWRFQGAGIKALNEHGYMNAQGELVNAGREDPIARRWGDLFTARYNEIGKQMPVFSQLRGCVDLAVATTLITNQDLLGRSGCVLPLLTDPSRLIGEDFVVPTTVASKASLLKGRKGLIVSVSGGVEIDTQQVLTNPKSEPSLKGLRTKMANTTSRWWWD